MAHKGHAFVITHGTIHCILYTGLYIVSYIHYSSIKKNKSPQTNIRRAGALDFAFLSSSLPEAAGLGPLIMQAGLKAALHTHTCPYLGGQARDCAYSAGNARQSGAVSGVKCRDQKNL